MSINFEACLFTLALLLRLSKTLTNNSVTFVAVMCLTASWAFWARPSLPRETDTELHVFRTAELGDALRHGALYPRWAANFYYGYGYPIFNYYAPLTYYLANLFSLALPGGAVFGTKFVILSVYFAAGFGIWGACRENGSELGIVCAAVYLFSPYFYLIDPHLRGAVAEFVSLGVAPLALWILLRWWKAPSRLTWLLSCLTFAAMMLSHNLMALTFAGMLAAYWLWARVIVPGMQRQPIELLPLLRDAAPLICGAGLSAFFWVPVFLEQDAVQLSNLIGPGHFDYRNHFVPILELLSPSLPLDLGAVNPEFRFNLGPASWMLACGGAAAALVHLVHHRGSPAAERALEGLFWALMAGGLVWLITPYSAPVWDALPQMAFFQFPWRLLGPAGLALALLSAQADLVLLDWSQQRRSLVEAAGVGLAILFCLPVFVPPGWDGFGQTDRLAVLDFELNGLALGTTSTGDYVPAAVDVVPGPTQSVIESYSAGGNVDRVNRAVLPQGAQVELIASGPTQTSLQVSTSEAFTLRLYIFAFAGWRASIDGRPVPIEVAKPEGFITLRVQAGEHIIRVWLGSTPARSAGTVASLISLAGMVALAYRLRGDSSQPAPQPAISTWAWASLAASLLIAGLGGWLAIFQPHSQGLIAQPAQVDQHHYVQGGVDLLGYSLPERQAAPGASLPLTLYWKAREPVPANFQVFTHLNTGPLLTWAQSDKLNPGDYPTARWPTDRYVRDFHSIEIPFGTPPGRYALSAGLWTMSTGARQLILEADGTILGDAIFIDWIEVLPAPAIPEQAVIPAYITPLGEPVLPDLELAGVYNQPADVLDQTNGLLTVNLYWRTSQPQADFQVEVRLANAAGETALATSGPPAGGQHPPADWASGTAVRDLHALPYTADLPAGTYTLEIRLVDMLGSPLTDWITVSSVERILPAP